MNEEENTKAINLARRVVEHNAKSKHYHNNNIINFDAQKIKDLKLEREKLNTIIKILYPKSTPEDFLYDGDDNKYIISVSVIKDILLE